ncbi:acrosomal protein KIAA1210 homolog [Rhinolophus sinicus]|uniref:acrosomal protein KIAA1210 homolog n=1 Tax=Rhinolophus sinicus TaxID=89399 RepID=UPI003D7AE07E
MGNKSLSHDSIFILDPEPERSASKKCHSAEFQKGKPLQRSHVFRTLPTAGSMHEAFSGAMVGVVTQYMPRSGIWVAGSKITEILPLRPCQPSISLPLLQSDTISKDFEEIFVEDESPKIPRKKALPQKILTLKKSSFEPSSGPVRSQSLTTLAMLTSPSSIQLPIGFSTPVSTQGCLDSSVALHKMVLNPQKQKKKNLQETVKPKQEEPNLPLVSEGKSTTRSIDAYRKKPPKDSAGPSSQEQSNKTELYDKTTDQAANTDAAGSQGYSWSAAYGRQCGKKGSSASGKSECGPRGRSSKQFSCKLGLGDRAGSPTADQTAQGSPFWHLSLEKQVMEKLRAPQAETATPQELLSDKNDMGGRKADVDVGARKASASHPIPEDTKESILCGPSPYHEDGASGAKKTEAKASLLPVVEIPSTTQQDVMSSVVVEAQVFVDPSHTPSEEEDASSFDSQSVQFKMDSARDIPTICKKSPPENVLQAFTASISGMASVLAEGGISAERLPPRCLSLSLGKPEAEEVSDSDSVSEEGSGSEQQLAPTYSFESLGKPKDGQEVFGESKDVVGKLSSSQEQLVPRCASQTLGEIEDEVSPGSNSYAEKYNSAEDWSSSEEDLPPRYPYPALGKPKDHQEISSVSKNTPEKWGVSVEQISPRHPSQPFVRPFIQQQVSSGSMSAFAEWELMPRRHFSPPWMSPKSEEQASAGPKSTALEWAISMEPLPPRMTPKHRRWHKVEQPVSSGPEIATIEGITSMELQPPRHHFQPLVKSTAEQEISASPECAVAEGSIFVEPPLPRYAFQPWMNPKVDKKVSSFPESTAVEGSVSMEPLPPKVLTRPLINPKVEQNVFSGSEGAERFISVEPLLPRYSSQSLTNPQAQHIFPENAASDKGMFVELLPPKYPCQPLERLKSQPLTVTHDSASASTECSSPVEPMPPRYTHQPWMSPKSELQASVGPESVVAERNISTEPLPPRIPAQPPIRPVVEQQVSSGSMSAPAESSGPVEPVPPRMPSYPLMKPVVKEPVSAGPESIVIKVDTSTELLPPRHLSIVRHKVQQMSSSFESAAVKDCISERPLPPKYPIHFLVRSKVQEISSCLENTAVEEGMSKKSLLPRHPSQSFVKFMEQQVFSEGPAIEEQIYVSPPSSHQPSKSLLRPKVTHQVFPDWESADIEGGISLKLLPTKCPLQSLGRPKDPQEVSSHSESDPIKWSSSQEQLHPRNLSQALGKLEYQRETSSVSESSPEEWCFQAEDGAEFQPQIFSTGSVSVPVEWISAEDHLPSRHPFQAFADPEYQQQVSLSSMSAAAAEGTIFENNPSSWSLPRDPASPNKTRKQNQGSEDLTKNILTPARKFSIPPTRPISASGDTYSKEEVLESSNRNNSYSNLPSSKADVENLFGVRLKKIPSSQKHKIERQDHFTKLLSLSLHPISPSVGIEPQIRRSASQGTLRRENLTTRSDFAEKQQSRPKSDSMAKNQPAHKIPGKAPGQQSDYTTSETACITMVKQRQKNFVAHIPMKELETKNTAGAKAEAMKPKYGGAENQLRNIFTSNVNRQEKMAQMKLPKSTKAGFEDQKIFQVPATRKETRRSSTLPAVLQDSAEPVWFSLAKKKAKAWSHIAEIMQ